MIKDLPLAHFSSALLFEWQMITSLQNIKCACPISAKQIDFYWNLPLKFPRNWPVFTNCFAVKLALKISANLSLKIRWNLTSVWHIRFDCLQISQSEVGINLEVKWLCLCDLAHFLWWKQCKIRWNVRLSLLF